MAALRNKTVALVVASGADQVEFTVTKQTLTEEGARVVIVSPKKEEVRLWRNSDWGENFPVDIPLLEAQASDYDVLVLPGGLIGADTLRSDTHAIRFIKEACQHAIPVAALGHAPWVLVEANALKGRKVTSHRAVRTDLINAGATWLDEGTVVASGIVTGRYHHDLPDFVAGIVDSLVAAR